MTCLESLVTGLLVVKCIQFQKWYWSTTPLTLSKNIMPFVHHCLLSHNESLLKLSTNTNGYNQIEDRKNHFPLFLPTTHLFYFPFPLYNQNDNILYYF